MTRFRKACLPVWLAAFLLLFIAACAAGEAYTLEDAGLDLTEEISVRYPALAGGEEEARTQLNSRLQADLHTPDYLARAAQLLGGGSLRTRWQGNIFPGEVLSCVLSASGALETLRPEHTWTAASLDLRDGHEITLAELFRDEEAGRETLERYLEEEVAPEMSPMLENSRLLPLPDCFYLEETGLTLLYPASQFTTLGDRAGDVRIGWHVLREVLDAGEDSLPARLGIDRMITLSPESGEGLRQTASGGALTGIPAKIGDSMQEMTDRWHLLTDPDGYEGGRLFALEGSPFRGVYLMTDDLDRGWENSRIQGIRLEQGCQWGLCIGETKRDQWLSALGEPDGTAEISAEKAEAARLVPGQADYYRCGEYLLQLYSDENGILASLALTE